jgi:1,4-dihydroxy-6-naphthoate synthase
MNSRRIRLGHSPDPDDAFMFYALAKDKIPCVPYQFEHILQDIQTLNQRALAGELEITAISIHAYPYVAHHYALTSCGASMGDGYGPVVVANKPISLDNLKGKIIAIPGELTTAFLALQLCLGRGARVDDEKIVNPAFKYVVIPFDRILNCVKTGQADAGLIIHEGQLTFESMNLHCVIDLGVWWQKETDLPLPLGGNCIRKNLGKSDMHRITNLLKQSIAYSLEHRQEAVQYALNFGRDLNPKLADRFVGMYVNHWTLDYGEKGRQSITRLMDRGAQAGLIPEIPRMEFIQAD